MREFMSKNCRCWGEQPLFYLRNTFFPIFFAKPHCLENQQNRNICSLTFHQKSHFPLIVCLPCICSASLIYMYIHTIIFVLIIFHLKYQEFNDSEHANIFLLTSEEANLWSHSHKKIYTHIRIEKSVVISIFYNIFTKCHWVHNIKLIYINVKDS